MGSQAAMLPQNTVERRNVVMYTHPVAAFFHCAAKVAAVVAYLVCGIFSASYVINFVVTAALLAIDFWIVKNVTGRLLVGLRWWNDVDEQGRSTWRFESLDQQALERINKNDAWIFWWPLYINTVVWTALAIIALIRLNFDYLVITIIAISLTSANTAGYSKCRKDAERRAQTIGQGFASSLFQAALGVSPALFIPCYPARKYNLLCFIWCVECALVEKLNRLIHGGAQKVLIGASMICFFDVDHLSWAHSDANYVVAGHNLFTPSLHSQSQRRRLSRRSWLSRISLGSPGSPDSRTPAYSFEGTGTSKAL